MKMPEVVSDYFDADRRNDPHALIRLFYADAVVQDEGECHLGATSIRCWWIAAKEKYRYTAETLEVSEVGEQVLVKAKISGEFPNSPVVLDFLFTVEHGKITTLEIK